MLLKIIAGYTDADDDLLDEQVAKKQKRSKIGKRSRSEVKKKLQSENPDSMPEHSQFSQ